MIETVVTLRPREEWRKGVTPETLQHEMEERLQFPGLQNAFTMPIKARVDMLTTGIRTPVGVKVSGLDLASIDDAAQRVELALRSVPGTRSVYAERQLAAVMVEVVPRRADLLRYGAVVDDVLDVVDLGLGGMPIGRVFEGRGAVLPSSGASDETSGRASRTSSGCRCPLRSGSCRWGPWPTSGVPRAPPCSWTRVGS
jgi:Cu(I)/Ag(I) efflux system membrane protein CusA/SilA